MWCKGPGLGRHSHTPRKKPPEFNPSRASASTAPLGATVGGATQGRRGVPSSPPCALCCTKGRRPGLCSTRQHRACARSRHSTRGQARGQRGRIRVLGKGLAHAGLGHGVVALAVAPTLTPLDKASRGGSAQIKAKLSTFFCHAPRLSSQAKKQAPWAWCGKQPTWNSPFIEHPP
jgi:hypothetical protein